MKEIELRISFDAGLTNDRLVEIFSKEIEDFSRWLEKRPPIMQQGALTKPERVLLLTYLMQKYAGNIDKE